MINFCQVNFCHSGLFLHDHTILCYFDFNHFSLFDLSQLVKKGSCFCFLKVIFSNIMSSAWRLMLPHTWQTTTPKIRSVKNGTLTSRQEKRMFCLLTDAPNKMDFQEVYMNPLNTVRANFSLVIIISFFNLSLIKRR